eukprot:Unigene2890_Nuclearia_a/m.8911 Unigene2890_Nuclearia_a/g.8911  ORF Unigene2890_Nuclearia_a/g.8911 Unigene2890_Nuclearia_a/m.8911 type:complete len:150 (+) Unigene2890_Nuclearia_a:82-531(+)
MASAAVATVRAAARRAVPRKAPIMLTAAAVRQLQQIKQTRPEVAGLRIGVVARGCSGFSYQLDFANKPEPLDETVEQDGIKVFIANKALFSIIGTEMDYKETPLASEFVFNNPNVTGMCGCGESFMVGAGGSGSGARPLDSSDSRKAAA